MRADCLPSADVTVRVNGTALTEHQTTNEVLTATSFVQADTGANFTIELKIEAGFAYRIPSDRIIFRALVDGAEIRRNVVATHLLPSCTSTIDGLNETKNGVSTLQRLSFAEHAFTDNNADASHIKKFASVGEIKVELIRCRYLGLSTVKNTHNKSFKTIVGENPIPEKAMKGRSVSNHTKLGRAETIQPLTWVEADYPYGTNPIATYVFSYRSRRDLEIEGVIERAPSPVPLADRNPEELTPDELREQVSILRAREALVVKQEPKRDKRVRERSATLAASEGEDDDDDDVTVVGQWERRKRARADVRTYSGDVIEFE